jgi:8-oxo-dGTP pyrophosphatase MutT (NUDIX family)
MEIRRVVTCFLERNGKILLVRRSGRVGTYQGKWGAVAGYIQKGETPLEAALREIEEETGVKNPKLVKEGEPFTFTDENLGITWEVHPFRFLTEEEVRIDWEHTEYRWISPQELGRFETVPKLEESWRRVELKAAGG